ncbi:hypothetical protein [Anoxybacillus gonensis]|uniref:hypothetical protein n=1 Tax=Anoxybacillus gonensis TaxID=198467 RepID=UPI0002BFEF6A|nr:hypothetical protein [Anoxybacillus gonensis]EMI11471.1 putative ABC transporter [Anoxybacillus gonensis]
MWRAWLSLDRKQFVRDPVLFISVVLPIGFMFTVAKGVPLFEKITAFSIYPHLPYLLSIFLLMTPITLGMMLGMFMLEERDEMLVMYLAVTPLGRGRYVVFRIGLPLLITMMLLILLVLVFPVPSLHRWKVFLFLLTSALEIPLMALTMLSFASNRLEGLAVAKMLNFMLLPSIVLYFFPTNWNGLALIFPTYWISQGVLALAENHNTFWGYWLGGTSYHVLLIWGLFRKFFRSIE